MQTVGSHRKRHLSALQGSKDWNIGCQTVIFKPMTREPLPPKKPPSLAELAKHQRNHANGAAEVADVLEAAVKRLAELEKKLMDLEFLGECFARPDASKEDIPEEEQIPPPQDVPIRGVWIRMSDYEYRDIKGDE